MSYKYVTLELNLAAALLFSRKSVLQRSQCGETLLTLARIIREICHQSLSDHTTALSGWKILAHAKT